MISREYHGWLLECFYKNYEVFTNAHNILREGGKNIIIPNFHVHVIVKLGLKYSLVC